MKKIIFGLILLVSCTTYPAYELVKIDSTKVDDIKTRCIKEESKTVWEYHWGYSWTKGKWCWHFGSHSVSECVKDEKYYVTRYIYRYDTVYAIRK